MRKENVQLSLPFHHPKDCKSKKRSLENLVSDKKLLRFMVSGLDLYNSDCSPELVEQRRILLASTFHRFSDSGVQPVSDYAANKITSLFSKVYGSYWNTGYAKIAIQNLVKNSYLDEKLK